MQFALTLIVSLFLSMALIPPLAHSARWLQMMDLPNERKVHEGGIPRIGGIAIVVGAVTPVLVWVPLKQEINGFLLGVAVLLFYGLWDDRYDLNYRFKFLGQLVAALVVVVYGGVVIERFPFMLNGPLPVILGAPLTVLALVGITNAVNLSDGLDGLAGGMALLSIGVMGVLAFLAEDFALAMIAVAMAGAILGFLRYNSYPARVFMGDTGSQFLGFGVGVMAVILTQTSSPALSPVLPVLLLGLPIIDTLAVIIRRVSTGRSPFSSDRSHIHHRLLQRGFDHHEAVLVIYVLHAVLVMTGYFLRFESDCLLMGLYGVFCIAIITVFRLMAGSTWQAHTDRVRYAGLRPVVEYLRRSRWLSRGPLCFVAFAVPSIYLLGGVGAAEVSEDLGVTALAMLGAILAASYSGPLSVSLVQRLAIYVTAAFSAYLLEACPGMLEAYLEVLNAGFVVLAVAIAAVLRFSREPFFRVSPLDFLVILIALVIPFLPELDLPADTIGGVAIKMLVLCYASEILLSSGLRHVLRFGTLAALIVLGVRGLM